MVKPEVRERLDDGALVFDNPAYDESIIGKRLMEGLFMI